MYCPFTTRCPRLNHMHTTRGKRRTMWCILISALVLSLSRSRVCGRCLEDSTVRMGRGRQASLCHVTFHDQISSTSACTELLLLRPFSLSPKIKGRLRDTRKVDIVSLAREHLFRLFLYLSLLSRRDKTDLK